MKTAVFATALVIEIAAVAALHFFDDWTLEQMPARFVFCAFAAGIAYFVAVAGLGHRRCCTAAIFWIVTVLLRLVALPLQPGDDLWRYQWEGKIQRAGFNPYVVTPDDLQLSGIRDSFDNWGKINHRDFSAIYPPAAQITFRALSAISERPLIWKLVFTVADLGVAALLLLLVRRDHAAAAWYAWNPLVVYSFAGAAHFDSLMLLPLVAAVVLLARHDEAGRSAGKWLLAIAVAVCFGLSISYKLMPLLLLPSAAIALRSRAPLLSISIAIAAALCALYGWPGVDIWNSLGRFAKVTRLNDLFWWFSEALVWSNPRQKNVIYNRILLAVVLLLSLVFWRSWRRGMLWVIGSALVLSPVLHPWYCTWILPFAAWRGARAWFVLSISVFAYYFFWNERLFLLPWHAELWQRLLIIAPPLAALLFSARTANRAPPVPA